MRLISFAVVALLFPGLAAAQAVVEAPWARATAPMAKAGGAFMTISSPMADQVTGVASLCALGKTSGDPLKSMFRYFKSEYEARIGSGSEAT